MLHNCYQIFKFQYNKRIFKSFLIKEMFFLIDYIIY